MIMGENYVTASSRSDDRYYCIDGLRGLGSLIVLFYHVFPIFFGQSLINARAFGLLLDGDMAVKLFFTLSGFSLSIGYLKRSKAGELQKTLHEILCRMAVARYLRLAIPSFLASLVVYVIYKLGINYYYRLPDSIKTEWWGWAYGDHPVSLGLLLRFSFYDIFFPAPFVPVQKYSGAYFLTNLWTMSIEFFGSYIVFLFLIIFGDKRIKALAELCLLLFFCYMNSLFSFFISGVILAEIATCNSVMGFRREKFDLFSTLAGFLILYPSAGGVWVENLHCSLIVIFVMIGRNFRHIFETKLFKYIGRISFPLYLVHMPVVITIQSYLFIKLNGTISMGFTSVCCGAATIIISLVLAHFFSYIDLWSIRLSRIISSCVLAR